MKSDAIRSSMALTSTMQIPRRWWEAHGVTPGFNPGICPLPDGGYLLAARHGWGSSGYVTLTRLSENLAPAGIPWRCPLPDVVEDPRLIVGPGGSIHLGMTVLICPQQVPDCEMALCRITGLRAEEDLGVSDYGVYSSVCGAHMEKNWGFFETPSGMMLVYDPGEIHTVYPLGAWAPEEEDAPKQPVVWETKNPGARAWQVRYGKPCGGTPPVLVDGLYWSVFHSSVVTNTERRYFAGLYAFQPEPPWTVVHWGKQPVLTYGPEDPAWYNGMFAGGDGLGNYVKVIFPAGLIVESHGMEKRYLMSYGYADGFSRIESGDWNELKRRAALD